MPGIFMEEKKTPRYKVRVQEEITNWGDVIVEADNADQARIRIEDFGLYEPDELEQGTITVTAFDIQEVK